MRFRANLHSQKTSAKGEVQLVLSVYPTDVGEALKILDYVEKLLQFDVELYDFGDDYTDWEKELSRD